MLKHNSESLHAHAHVPTRCVIAPPTGKKTNKKQRRLVISLMWWRRLPSFAQVLTHPGTADTSSRADRADRPAAEIQRPGSCGGEDELLCVAEWQRSSPLWLSCRAAGQEMKLLAAMPRARPPPLDAAGGRHENVVAAGWLVVVVVEGRALQTCKSGGGAQYACRCESPLSVYCLLFCCHPLFESSRPS